MFVWTDEKQRRIGLAVRSRTNVKLAKGTSTPREQLASWHRRGVIPTHGDIARDFRSRLFPQPRLSAVETEWP